jgi:hypothetical protein
MKELNQPEIPSYNRAQEVVQSVTEILKRANPSYKTNAGHVFCMTETSITRRSVINSSKRQLTRARDNRK